MKHSNLVLLAMIVCLGLFASQANGKEARKESEKKLKEMKECNQNLARFVKCMKLTKTFNTKYRFKTHADDCYGIIHTDCLKNYCTEEQYLPIREFEYCKYWFFGCEILKDTICGRINSDVDGSWINEFLVHAPKYFEQEPEKDL